MLKLVMTIEIPVVHLTLSSGQFHDLNWQPNRIYWSGHKIVLPVMPVCGGN